MSSHMLMTSDSVGDGSSGSVGVHAYPDKHEISTYTKRPEITIKDIDASDDKIMLYTGWPTFVIFNSLFLTLIEFGADKLCTEKLNTC